MSAVAEGPSEDATTSLHASAVLLGESGVLIRGESGAGKSALALALVEAWRLRGDFACLVGDDRIRVRIAHGRALLAPHAALAGLAEWRGVGLLAQDHENAAVLALIIDLEGPETLADRPRLPESEDLRAHFLGLDHVARLRLAKGETSRSVATIMAFLHKMAPK